MVFIHEGQTSQIQQSNLELIQQIATVTTEAIENFSEVLAELAQLTLQQTQEKESPEKKPTYEDYAATVNFVASAGQVGLVELSSDQYSMSLEVDEDGTGRYIVLDEWEQCCLYVTKNPGERLAIDHISSSITPEKLAEWSDQLESMSYLNSREPKDLDWLKECYEQAPDWCPRGTSAILVADKLLTASQTSSVYSDKTNMTFQRTTDGIALIREDKSIACELNGSGIQSNLTQEESRYFGSAFNQFTSAQAAAQNIKEFKQKSAVNTPRGFERTPFE